MIKNNIRKIIAAAMAMFMFLTAQSSAYAAETSDKPIVSFSAISDIHIKSNGDSNFEEALKDLNKANPNSAATCIVGDMTEDGSDSEYDTYNRILNSVKHNDVYSVMGNHDVRYLKGGYTEAINRYKNKTGMPGSHFDKWINGYHFIFLNTEKNLKDEASLSQEELTWLKEKLAENASATTPIFLFLHQSLEKTSAGSYSQDGYTTSGYPDGIVEDSKVRDILSQYPQTFFITGHTHATVNNPKTVYTALGYKCVNTGSAGHTTGYEEYGLDNETQGICVDVYKDNVVIKGRDLKNGKWVSDAKWTIPTLPVIPKSKMSATATSEENTKSNDVAANVLDGNSESLWHTKWNSSDSLPQSITLNLGGKYKLGNFSYLPRQNKNNGNITTYNLYTSIDGINFTKQISNGKWENNAFEKFVKLPSVEASYVKLEALEGVGNWAAAAEINAYGTPVTD